MGKVGASLQLPYPAETVYRVATRIEDLPQWLPEVVEAERRINAELFGALERFKALVAAEPA